MTRTPFWVLVLALAVSACGDAGEGDLNGGAGNSEAAAGNGPAGLQAAKAGGSASSSQSAPGSPSNAQPAARPRGAATLAGMPGGEPLGPILDEDVHTPELTGCNCRFDAREGSYLSVIAGELMVRTPAGRQLCPISDPQLQSLGTPGGEVSCAGVRMSIRETGERVAEIASDSSSAPAILTATQEGVTGTLEGEWGCAC